MTKREIVAAGAKPTQQALRSVTEIRGYHELGRQVVDRETKRGMTRAEAALTVSSSRHAGKDRATKAARFFELYPKGLPHWLLALCVVPENNPLTVNHIRTVL